MSWYADLPKGARVLILIVATIIAATLLYRGGYIVGQALTDTSYADEGE
ncbi:hypothetical protein [Aurantiacibacter hainanensis]